jgi:hypothetical protein
MSIEPHKVTSLELKGGKIRFGIELRGYTLTPHDAIRWAEGVEIQRLIQRWDRAAKISSWISLGFSALSVLLALALPATGPLLALSAFCLAVCLGIAFFCRYARHMSSQLRRKREELVRSGCQEAAIFDAGVEKDPPA